MGIRERILKNETKRIAGHIVSEEKANKVANFIFDENESQNTNTKNIPINQNSTDENNVNTEDDVDNEGVLSKIDSWLTKKEKEIEKTEQNTPDPVTDLDDMENRINELDSEISNDDNK